MTLDELRAWLAQSPTGTAEVLRLRRLADAAAAGATGALAALQHLKTREVVRIAKYDKTHATAAGTEGLSPFEVVDLLFEDGRLIETVVTRADEEAREPCH